jgi:hypothetical protein
MQNWVQIDDRVVVQMQVLVFRLTEADNSDLIHQAPIRQRLDVPNGRSTRRNKDIQDIRISFATRSANGAKSTVSSGIRSDPTIVPPGALISRQTPLRQHDLGHNQRLRYDLATCHLREPIPLSAGEADAIFPHADKVWR